MMPGRSQNSPQKSSRSSRRFTTLSFEQIDRGSGVFTEDISAASRVPRPTFVIRHNEVLGANMPDTIRLAKHRSKVYVGLTDPPSARSSQLETRSTSHERSSAATTIGRASIVDWQDAASDLSGSANNMTLAGELSITFPPVPGAQNSSKQPSPGVDTNEASFRPRNGRGKAGSQVRGSSRKLADTSLRLPPSKGGAFRTVGGFRTPMNTPFSVQTRPDEFSPSLRNRLTLHSPRGSSNVLVCGGGITPVSTSRLHINNRSFLRENTLGYNKMKNRKELSLTGMGTANFDLPVIDLKCIESPVTNLGNLEEKGIRLVRLRSMMKGKKRTSSQSGEGKNDVSSDTSQGESTSKRNSLVDDHKETLDGTTRFILASAPISASKNGVSSRRSEMDEVLDENVGDAVRTGLDTDPLSKRMSVSTSPSFSGISVREDVEQIGTNRGSYTTPLLPNQEPSKAVSPRLGEAPNPNAINSQDHHELPSNSMATEARKEEIKTEAATLQGQPQHFAITVENVGATPDPRNSPSQPADDHNYDDEARVFDDEGDNDEVPTEWSNFATKGRWTKRSSSLLSVPVSETVSEKRPDLWPPQDNTGRTQDAQDTWAQEEALNTIATQTTPPNQ